MRSRSAKEIGEELKSEMEAHIEHLSKRVYLAVDEMEIQEEEARLRRIRELSAEYLMALRQRDGSKSTDQD